MSHERIVKICMLIGIVALCGFGYIMIVQNLGVSDKIVGNSTDNSTLVKENSSYYDEGKGLLVGSDMLGTGILIFCILMFIVLLYLALKSAHWI
jgi:hypothetical protein